jgi:hypothetical protein
MTRSEDLRNMLMGEALDVRDAVATVLACSLLAQTVCAITPPASAWLFSEKNASPTVFHATGQNRTRVCRY